MQCTYRSFFEAFGYRCHRRLLMLSLLPSGFTPHHANLGIWVRWQLRTAAWHIPRMLCGMNFVCRCQPPLWGLYTGASSNVNPQEMELNAPDLETRTIWSKVCILCVQESYVHVMLSMCSRTTVCTSSETHTSLPGFSLRNSGDLGPVSTSSEFTEHGKRHVMENLASFKAVRWE